MSIWFIIIITMVPILILMISNGQMIMAKIQSFQTPMVDQHRSQRNRIIRIIFRCQIGHQCKWNSWIITHKNTQPMITSNQEKMMAISLRHLQSSWKVEMSINRERTFSWATKTPKKKTRPRGRMGCRTDHWAILKTLLKAKEIPISKIYKGKTTLRSFSKMITLEETILGTRKKAVTDLTKEEKRHIRILAPLKKIQEISIHKIILPTVTSSMMSPLCHRVRLPQVEKWCTLITRILWWTISNIELVIDQFPKTWISGTTTNTHQWSRPQRGTW